MTPQILFSQAVRLHQTGEWAEAARLYGELLRKAPRHLAARQLLAMLYFQQARYPEALEEIGKALAFAPQGAEAWAIQGNILLKLARAPEALQSFDRALAAKPDYLEALYNRGNCLYALGRFEAAVQSYGQVLERQADYEPALTNRGNALRALKRRREALQDYEKALRLKPDDAGLDYNRGQVLQDLKRFQDALAAYDAALRKKPDHAEAWNNRGSALAELGRWDDALASYDRALALNPLLAEARNNRGNCLRRLERRSEALADYDRALALNERLAEAWNNRGAVLRDLRRLEEAVTSFDKALLFKPDYAAALFNRAALNWSEWGRYEPARADLERAVALDPDYDYGLGHLLHLRMQGGDWQGFEALKNRIDRGVREGGKCIEPFAYQAISESPQDLATCAQIYASDRYPAAAGPARKPLSPRRRIRLGYVSGEFRAQATAYLAAGLYERHDRERFEVIAFDNGESDGSPVRLRLQSAFDRFIDISRFGDREAAAKIASEEVDILIDLNGYFGRQRMGVFARRPAPIQVNYLGFPGTLGAPYMDYILADRTVIPETDAQFYSEKIVWLPDSYQVNDRDRETASTGGDRPTHGLPAQAFVFCNFNQGYKLTPKMFESWMRILRQVPQSVLWLWETNPEFPVRLREEAERQGVAGGRLIFAGTLDLSQHLARLAHADLVLDTLPYGAHTTASDALWAGAPVLTCYGPTFPGRVGASLLSAVGLPELIAENLDAYEALAVRLAGDRAVLEAVKEKLARNRLRTPLFDTARFCRHVEAAYRQMWEMARKGEEPRSFRVAALPSP